MLKNESAMAQTNLLIASGTFDRNSELTRLTLSSGAVLTIPTETLMSFQADAMSHQVPVREQAMDLLQEFTIPLLEERLHVGKRIVEREKIRLRKEVEERTESIDVALTQVNWDIHHVPVGRVVEQTPEVRVEGETTIYPVMEERLTVVRQLLLKEEVHIKRATAVVNQNVSATLRRERLVEERETLNPAM